MVHIPHIKFKFLLPGDGIPAIHLSPSGNPRAYIMPALLKIVVEWEVLHQQRSGTDQRHIPFDHVQQLGISSSEVDRTNRPAFVSRCSSGSRFPAASRSSVIVLNLMTLKIFSFFPGRSCRKKAPAPLLTIVSQPHTIRKMGLMMINPERERVKSSRRLMNFLYIFGIKSCLKCFFKLSKHLYSIEIFNAKHIARFWYLDFKIP